MWLETKKARNFNAVVWVLGEVNGYMKTYRIVDNGLNCFDAPCPSWDVTDTESGESPSENDIAFPKTRLLSSFIFGLFSRTSAVTTTPWQILSTAMNCYNTHFRRNSRTTAFSFPWNNQTRQLYC